MSKIVALIIATQAKDRGLLHIINYEEKEKIDMYESMRLYKERTLNEGKKINENIIRFAHIKTRKMII